MEQSSSEKPVVLQLVHKVPALYGRRRFIAALTKAGHFSLSWFIQIRPRIPHPGLYDLLTFVIFSSTPRSSWLFFSFGFPSKSCMYFFSPMRVPRSIHTSSSLDHPENSCTSLFIKSCILRRGLKFLDRTKRITRESKIICNAANPGKGKRSGGREGRSFCASTLQVGSEHCRRKLNMANMEMNCGVT